MMTTITPQNITAAEDLGTVTIDAPDAIHVRLDADRGVQVMEGWNEYEVYLADAWTPLSSPRIRAAATWDGVLDLIREFRDA